MNIDVVGFIFQNYCSGGHFFKNIRDINRYYNTLDFLLIKSMDS